MNVTNNISRSAEYVRYGYAATSGRTFSVSPENASRPIHRKQPEDVKYAVYSHIKALRALGRTQVSTLEIADALSLDRKLVDAAVRDLGDAGVKLAR